MSAGAGTDSSCDQCLRSNACFRLSMELLERLPLRGAPIHITIKVTALRQGSLCGASGAFITVILH